MVDFKIGGKWCNRKHLWNTESTLYTFLYAKANHTTYPMRVFQRE